MGEKDRRAPIPSLFDPIPKQLVEDEQRIRATYDGTIGSDGIIMTLNPITGAPIRAIFIDLFRQKANVTFEPLDRAKWASRKKDIKTGSKEHAKLDAIEEAVKAKWQAWRIANPHHPPIREFKASFFSDAVQAPVQLEQEDIVVTEIIRTRRRKKRAEGFIKPPEKPTLIYPQVINKPELSERVNRIRDELWEQYLRDEKERHGKHKKKKHK